MIESDIGEVVAVPPRFDNLVQTMLPLASPDEAEFLGYGISTIVNPEIPTVYGMRYNVFSPSKFMLADSETTGELDPRIDDDKISAGFHTTITIFANLLSLTQRQSNVRVFQLQTMPLETLDDLKEVEMPNFPAAQGLFTPDHYLFVARDGSMRPYAYEQDKAQLIPMPLLMADDQMSESILAAMFAVHRDILYENLPV